MTCRACSGALVEVIDMGNMPLAGDFRLLGEKNALFPLAVDVCAACGLLQVREVPPLDTLFNEHYSYASSTIGSLVEHFRTYAELASHCDVGRKLLEVGCNDGIFLKPLRQLGFDVVGIDASNNVAEMARACGLRVQTGIFNESKAKALVSEHGRFDIITCSNVFAHNPDINGFLAGVSVALSETGEFWVEVHSALALHATLQWDCFYHEHCFYWTPDALVNALRRWGFYPISVQATSMHGGGIRARFSRRETASDLELPQLDVKDWLTFSQRAIRSRDVLADSIARLEIEYAYGAAGRAVTLINWARLPLAYVVDGSPLRAGKAIPNMDIPIISESEFRDRPLISDWCLVSAHNYVDSIAMKVRDWFPDNDVKFVTPLPHVTIR
jgi:predicted TPR repeat methyltransferase